MTKNVPGLLVIGPMKSGTTWIYNYLKKRGDVCLPQGVKETFFFDRNSGKPLSWYMDHFDHYDADLHNVVVEVAPSYFHCPNAPERVASTLGNVKLIAIRRDPVERAWSHYRHMVRYGYTSKPLADAIADHPEIIRASRYEETLSEWQQFFPCDSLATLSFDKLKHNEAGFVADLCEVLGVEYVEAYEQSDEEMNTGASGAPQLLSRTARHVADRLRARRLYWVVNLAKELGLKRMVYGNPSVSREMKLDEQDRQLLIELVS